VIVTPTELVDELNSADGKIYIADPSERVRAQGVEKVEESALVVEPEQIVTSDLAPNMPCGISIYYRPVVPARRATYPARWPN
jgi:hypothetical protein